MRFCDITIAYNDRSGGIRTYIDEKRRYLLDHTPHDHLLIIPGETSRIERDGRAVTVHVAGPLLPNQDDYRCFLSPIGVRNVLARAKPDVIELGSYYVEPWAAFAYRRRRREAGRTCVIGGYFHTDVAAAYVAAPLRAAAHAWLSDVSRTLGGVAEGLADLAALGAEKYIGGLFNTCDLAFAAGETQAARLREYGVPNVHIVPMGVDLALFDPARRDPDLRAALGATTGAPVLIYAGRLGFEKRVLTLIDAVNAIKQDAHLWIVGDGPLRADIESAKAANPRIRLLPYENDRERFARLLASADIYVTAGPHETFGLSVIEAQASGLPVVGVDAGALQERTPPGLGYLGPVDDAQAMARNIERALERRVEIGARARRHVERHFGWDTAFEQLVAHYEDAASIRSYGRAARHRPVELAP